MSVASIPISHQIKDVISKAELEESNDRIAQIAASSQGEVPEEGAEQPEELFEKIPEDHYVIAYGPNTVEYIQ